MDFGVMLNDVPLSVSPQEHFDGVLRQVEAAQRNGLTYILIGQHFIFPEFRWLQPIPLLARLAGEVDPHVRLVTQVMIAPLYHPVLLAEELATLDIVSDGRLVVGLGLGYRTTEYRTMGVNFKERGRRMEEIIRIVKAMWTNDRVTYHGDFWNLEDVPIHLRPVQDPHPPLWIGADSRVGISRAARLGDAWPIPPQVPEDQAARRLQAFIDERLKLGLPVRPQPMRREIVVGDDLDDATARAVKMAGPQLAHMAGVNDTGTVRGKGDPLTEVVQRSFILGSAADCARRLRSIAEHLPVNPIITRAGWAGMTTEASIEYLDSLGRELIPALKDEPVAEAVASPA